MRRFDEGMIAPGFVDLQVNGGGGVMLNDDPSVEAIEKICAAHRPFGTTSLLPTLITDTREKTKAAIAAGIEAQRRGVPGFRGLHLEGPHLSIARKGAHDPALIRPMDEEDVQILIEAKKSLETLYVTVAPESVTPAQISRLSKAGIVVSIGHSDTNYETAAACFEAGATSVTHLFNAMSQIGNREPGLAGAALDAGSVFCGLIADGFHVHEAVMRAALRAKPGPGRIFLVTDAMSTVGSDITSFTAERQNHHPQRRPADFGRRHAGGGGCGHDLLRALRAFQTWRFQSRGAAHGLALSGAVHRARGGDRFAEARRAGRLCAFVGGV